MEQMNPYQAPGADVSAIPGAEGYDETSPFSPKGRFGRLSYIAWAISFTFLAALVVGAVGGGFAAMRAEAQAGSGFLLLAQLVMTVVVALFAIRRLHDINASGWWALLMLVPVVNGIFGLVLLFKAGSEGANSYGPPRLTRGWEKVLGFIGIGFMILAVVGIIAAILIPMMAR